MLKGEFAFLNHDPAGRYPYAMFVWLVLGGERPIMVDTGPRSIEEINKGIASLVYEPTTQRPGEDILSHLARNDVEPSDVSHLFLTHLHYDHVSNLHLFPNARIVVNKRGWEEANRRKATWVPGEVLFPLREEWNDRLTLVEDEEVLSGIRTFWMGGHTPCSQAVVVQTDLGRAAVAGDVVSLYANLDLNIPVGVAESFEECLAAMARVRRESDIILPGHDPDVLNRFPGGVIS